MARTLALALLLLLAGCNPAYDVQCVANAKYKVGDLVSFVANDQRGQIIYINCHRETTFDVRIPGSGNNMHRVEYVREFELEPFKKQVDPK